MKGLLLGCAALLAVGITVVVLISGSHHRSVAATCHVWDTQGLALHNQFNSTSGSANPLGELSNVMAAPSEVADLMSKMASVAPNYVAPDFSEIAKALHQSAQTSLLGALSSAFTISAETAGPSRAVNSFLSQHCGIPGKAGNQ